MRRVLLACSLLLLPALCGCDGPSLLKAEQAPEYSATDFQKLVADYEAIPDDDSAAIAKFASDRFGGVVHWIAIVDAVNVSSPTRLTFVVKPFRREPSRLMVVIPEAQSEALASLKPGDMVSVSGRTKFYTVGSVLGVVSDATIAVVPRLDGSGESAEPTPRSFGVEHREEGRAYFQKPTAEDIARDTAEPRLGTPMTAIDHERIGHVWIEDPEQAITSRDEDGTVRVEAKLGRYVDPATKRYTDNGEPFEGELPDSEQAD